MRYYELVGPPHDLDDGEASAIAVAEHFSGTLVIDEAKGRRVASSSPACRKILSSVDLFRHPEIAEALGSDLPEAIDSALKNSRMRVLLEDTAWVVKIIGREKAVMHVGLRKNMSKLGV